MNTLLHAALELAGRGFAIFPSAPGTNIPMVKRWPDVATTQPDQIGAWWRQWPRANVSHCAGRSGVVVIDLDGPAGIESWRSLQRRHGAVPTTLTVLSPRAGGVHLYFAAPPFYVASTAGKLAPGVDVRGSRGQAVLPPSSRPDGTYRWANDAEPARPPEWLVDLLRPAPPPPRRAQTRTASIGRLAGLVRAVVGAAEGCRNSTLHWAACRAGEMVARGADPKHVTDLLVDAAVSVGLTPREAHATVRSGLAKALR